MILRYPDYNNRVLAYFPLKPSILTFDYHTHQTIEASTSLTLAGIFH